MPKLTPNQIRILKKISDPEIRQKYAIYYQLPQKVQDILFATNTADKIQEIILKRYKLSHEQLWIGSYITGMVLLGITPYKEFPRVLEEKLEVAPDVAQAIARDIDEQIFAQVSEELKGIQKELPRKAVPKAKEVKPEPEIQEKRPSPIRPPEIPGSPRLPEERRSEPETPLEPEEVGPKIKGNVIDLKGSAQEDEPKDEV